MHIIIHNRTHTICTKPHNQHTFHHVSSAMRPTSGVLGPAWERAAGGAASTWSRRPLRDSSQGRQPSLGRSPRISAGAFLGHTGGGSCRCQWRWVKAGPGALPGTREDRETGMSRKEHHHLRLTSTVRGEEAQG